MALYTVKEFASMCGVTTSYVKVNIGRGKVVLNSDHLIDGLNETNQFFYEKRTQGKDVERLLPPPPAQVMVPPPTDTPPSHVTGIKTMASLDKDKKLKDLEKTDAEIRLLKLKEAKLHGILIPTELVKSLFTQHTKSIVSAFHYASENLITEFTKRKQMTGSEVAEMRHQLTSIINTASVDALNESMKQVKHIQEEYSQKRERGERT